MSPILTTMHHHSLRSRPRHTRFAIEGHGWEGAVTVLGGDPSKVLLQLGEA